jgi:MSHA type pilus biogenesis protein MshL
MGAYMKELRICFAIILCLSLVSCALKTSFVKEPENSYPDYHTKEIKTESNRLAGIQKELLDSLGKTPARKVEVEPIMPVYNPLEDHRVSFSMVDEDLEPILYSLSQAVGMSLIIDPSISKDSKSLTLNFENVSADKVLKEILDTFDLFYEIDKNVIRVKPFQERIFTLNFLDSTITTNFDVGGDVLGAGDTEMATGLSGNVKLTGQGTKNGNIYDVLENMVKQVISKGGKYSLNRLSGSLYVKDTPTVIRSISTLINHFKEMLSRQILIEARIVEVTLSDEYKYGIDWDLLRNLNDKTPKLTNASWSLGTGLVLGGVHTDWTINATINALKTFGDTKVVSNPSIRSKHGKPAIISVGTSFTYKKSVEVTRESSSTQDRDITEVEVSTVFDGLILGVIPFIEEGGRITLLINPIKSDVDQASLELENTGAGQSISLPVVHIKEISTTIALNSGDMVMLGGLIDKRHSTENMGVPILSSIPIFGYLFKNEFKSDVTREMVIILSVNVI